MTIEALTKAVTPPASPVHAKDQGRWAATEDEIGLQLPADYRDFATAYGTGRISDPQRLDLRVLNPLDPTYRKKVLNLADLFRELKEFEGDDYVPFGIYPDRPGLLPWGSDDHGNTLFWLTEGEPDQWPIVLNADSDSDFERVDLRMTEFLANVLSNRKRCDFLWKPPFFTGPEKVRFELLP